MEDADVLRIYDVLLDAGRKVPLNFIIEKLRRELVPGSREYAIVWDQIAEAVRQLKAKGLVDYSESKAVGFEVWAL